MPLNETSNNTVQYTVTTTNTADGTVLYWKTTGNTTNSDIVGGNTGSITVTNNQAIFNVTILADETTEGTKTLGIAVVTGSQSGPTVVTTPSPIIVNDTSITPANFTVEYLIIAGGGAGGVTGGGGAGGVLYGSFSARTTSQYTLTVGAGGVNQNGQNSSLSGPNDVSAIAIGGGKGGGDTASSGGSGGGGGGSYSGGAGTAGQGQNGGGGYAATYSGGGGGGAGSPGGTAGYYPAGAGGSGTNAYSAWLNAVSEGTSGYTGGGGGGGQFTTCCGYQPAGGGFGGGGSGGVSSGGNGQYNTGSGGGGSGSNPGSGASGLILLRWNASVDSNGVPISPTGGSNYTSGGYTYRKFNSSGTFTA
jgi:hypothetical protein